MEDYPPATFNQFPNGAAQRICYVPFASAILAKAVGCQNDVWRQSRRFKIHDGSLNRGLVLQAIDNLLLIVNLSRAPKLDKLICEQVRDILR